MKLNLMFGCAALVALVLVSSCGDDPAPKAGISFEVTELSVSESDGTLTSFHPDLFNEATGKEYVISFSLDRELTETTVLKYTLGGTASRVNPAGTFDVNDFSVKEGVNTIVSSDKITIEEGAASASIIVTVYEDYDFEIDDDDNLFETAIFELTEVVSGYAELADENLIYTLTIEEDDILVFLDWVANDSPDEDRGDVDMDLLLQLEDEVIWGSAEPGNEFFEAMNVPGGFPAGTYGLSYTYYSGTSDDLDFISVMFNTKGTLNGGSYKYPVEDPLIFESNYTLENINEWGEDSPPKVVQTMVKNGINYSNITSITNPPDGGSRVKARPDLSISNATLQRLLKSQGKLKLK